MWWWQNWKFDALLTHGNIQALITKLFGPTLSMKRLVIRKSGVMLVSFFLCWLIKDAQVKQLDEDFSYFSLAQKTIRFVKQDRRQLLLIPITFFSGDSRSYQFTEIFDWPKFSIRRNFRPTDLFDWSNFKGNSASYIAGTFTFSFITCGFGPEWIGLIMIAFGITGTITSLSLGYLKSKIDRILIVGFGFVCQLGLLLAILGKYIYPHPEHIEWLFIMAGRDSLTSRWWWVGTSLPIPG